MSAAEAGTFVALMFSLGFATRSTLQRGTASISTVWPSARSAEVAPRDSRIRVQIRAVSAPASLRRWRGVYASRWFAIPLLDFDRAESPTPPSDAGRWQRCAAPLLRGPVAWPTRRRAAPHPSACEFQRFSCRGTDVVHERAGAGRNRRSSHPSEPTTRNARPRPRVPSATSLFTRERRLPCPARSRSGPVPLLLLLRQRCSRFTPPISWSAVLYRRVNASNVARTTRTCLT